MAEGSWLTKPIAVGLLALTWCRTRIYLPVLYTRLPVNGLKRKGASDSPIDPQIRIECSLRSRFSRI